MLKHLSSFALAAALATGVEAQPLTTDTLRSPVGVWEFRPINLAGANGNLPAPSRLIILSASRFEPDQSAMTPARTALDHQFAPGGLFAQFGYFCLSDDPQEETHLVGLIAGSQDGRLVGGTIRYPFR